MHSCNVFFSLGVYVGAVLLQEDEAQPTTRARPVATRGKLVTTRGRQPIVTLRGRRPPVPVRGKRAALLPIH